MSNLIKAAYFLKTPDVFEPFVADDFQCALSARITPTRCYLYLVSGSPSCMMCLAKLMRLRRQVDAGAFVDIERAPILRFYLDSRAGKGLPAEITRFINRQKMAYRPATGFIPPDRATRRRAEAERKLAALMPKAEPVRETIEVVKETPKVVKRRKPVWVDTCDGCKKRREIVAWGLCSACLAAGR